MADDDAKPAATEPDSHEAALNGDHPQSEPVRAIVPTPHVLPAPHQTHSAAPSVDHPPRPPQEISPDPVVRERKPLNPAYAILAGAVLTAASGITATFLTIRSSERLTRERDRTDLARQERDDLAKELEKVKADLANQSEQLQQFSSTTIAVPVITQQTIPPSIVVVLPPQATVVPTVTVTVPTTKAPVIPEERQTTVPEPTLAPTIATTVPAPTTAPPSSTAAATTSSPPPTLAPSGPAPSTGAGSSATAPPAPKA